jgi:hypothetical protein
MMNTHLRGSNNQHVKDWRRLSHILEIWIQVKALTSGTESKGRYYINKETKLKNTNIAYINI